MFNYDLGPGLRSMPADSSSSSTTAPDRQRGGRDRYIDPRNSNRRSTALSNDEDTLIDARHSCVTASVVDSATRVVVNTTGQSPNKTTATENMAATPQAG